MSLKEEAENSLIYIIKEIVNLFISPIKKLTNYFISKLRQKLINKNLQRGYVAIEYRRLINDICVKYNSDVLAFRLHNGLKSESGYSFKNIKVFFARIDKWNSDLKDFCKVSVPTFMYGELVDICIKKRIEQIENLQQETIGLFGKYKFITGLVVDDIYLLVFNEGGKFPASMFSHLMEMIVHI